MFSCFPGSLLEFMEDARECFEQPWLKAMTNEFHDQVSWLGLALAGEWKRACAVGPKLSPKVLEALGVSLSDTYCPVALWWQPTVKDAVAKLCQTHNIEPHEIAQVGDIASPCAALTTVCEHPWTSLWHFRGQGKPS